MDKWTTDKEFLQTFRAEAEERLQALAKGLISLEETPGDEELVKRLFREAHTLKGSAGMMGLDAIRVLSHRVEDILAAVQKGQMEISSGIADLLLETLDRIEELLPTGEETDIPGEEAVSELLQRLENIEQRPAGAPQDTPAGGQTADVPRQEAPAADDMPTAADAQPTAADAQPTAAEDHAAPSPAPQPLVAVPDLPPQARAEETGPRRPEQQMKAHSDSTIRVNIERLDKLLNLMGEVLVNQVDAEQSVRDLATLQTRTQEIENVLDELRNLSDQMRENDESGMANTLNNKVNRAQEMLMGLGGNLARATSNLKDNTTTRRLALDELQEKALNVRMLPLSTIFSLYPRVVRDASHSCGKNVKLIITGEKTELDKRILEEISDPLMHIIRNCVDHGIEFSVQRTEEGKPEQGTIQLSAHQRGDRVEIEVADDGAGINTEQVKAAAVRKGLLREGDTVTLDDINDLLFKPGLTTANSVTEISGRGVGLDIVKNNIEKLEGTITVETTPGVGTRFVVSLPVTLAVVPGLVVASHEHTFVIPMAAVQELAIVHEWDIHTLGTHRGFMQRGNAVPLIDLTAFLGGDATPIKAGRARTVVIGNERQRIGLHVERLIGEQEIVIKPLGEYVPRLPFFAGVTILGNGEAVLVLNASELLRGVRQNSVSLGDTVATEDEEEERTINVLIVEDSVVVRELQRNILQAAGYNVRTAVDGNDAMKRLAESSVDCVITDVEMPGMNGFELTSTIRKTPETREMPIVIVSSLASEEDRQKGVEAGANAYVVKGSFDQQGLLDTIERLVA